MIDVESALLDLSRTHNVYNASVTVMSRVFRPNQPVVYVAVKRSVHPGPGSARDIIPETQGEGYLYQVNKFWLVEEVNGQTFKLRTRTGKTHEVDAGDPSVRPASWWERFMYRDRFPIRIGGRTSHYFLARLSRLVG